MTATDSRTIRPAPDLSDELWTWRHVAAYTHRCASTVNALVSRPGCPAPVGFGDRLWVAEEFKVWFLAQRTPRPARRRATRTTAEPAPLIRIKAPGRGAR